MSHITLQQIGIGAVANDRTGDTWRGAMQKVNANNQIIEDDLNAIGLNFIAQESDFATQDATTITLEAGELYFITAAFSTAKQFICKNGAAITSFNQFGPLLTYSGVSAMFDITDANFSITEINITCPNAVQVYDAEDTAGGNFIFIQRAVNVVKCKKLGTFDDLLSVTSRFSQSLDCDDGFSFIGTSGSVISISELAILSSSATFKGIDLGTAVPTRTIELTDLLFSAPAGAFGISGLASSGNVPANRLATVNQCEFLGGMTDLENITSSDIRWRFDGNTPTADTEIDALARLTANATETVISVASTPVLIAGTWAEVRSSLMTVTTGGRVTMDSERNALLPIGISGSISAASGTNKDIRLYLAKNGAVITNGWMPNRVGAADPKNTTVLWQDDVAETDYYETFLSNETDTINLIAENVHFRFK